jgi:hypothetical protein
MPIHNINKPIWVGKVLEGTDKNMDGFNKAVVAVKTVQRGNKLQKYDAYFRAWTIRGLIVTCWPSFSGSLFTAVNGLATTTTSGREGDEVVVL